ncbi:type II toxin-antitoxin system RelE/ParE family toxin [Pseudomonas sp. NFXW11]|uniref:type II toxin-antitoxin system RelE/ParE family toxin n=1 Tax=Pseudomonas sp. NFXW11 TaxID=2819531 RepID=UPI003CEE16EB
MAFSVEFSAAAMEQLLALYRYIATAASPQIAQRYTDAIVTHCEALKTFPHRGNLRDDIRPGLRITHYRKRAVIAFAVEGQKVYILGVFYGGQDFAAARQLEPDDQPL